MNSNTHQLLSLTGFELAKLGDQFEAKYGYESDTNVTGDVTKLLALNTPAPINEGVAFEMQALGFDGEVVAPSQSAPPVSVVKRDLTDWANVIG